MHIPLKVAVVKSAVYQDLWVCDITRDIIEVFKTTLMRTSPIGMLEMFDAEFIIVKESNEYPCNINKCCFPIQYHYNLKYAKEGKTPGQPDETFHKHITIDSVSYEADTIDWSQYHIVITINACIPERVIRHYPGVLWCYYMGENTENLLYNKFDCYDVVFNQDVLKSDMPEFMIGMPYSYMGPHTIEAIVGYLGAGDQSGGIMMEINNTTDRPVASIPPEFVRIGEATRLPIVMHSQNIVENIRRISGAKYFVKLLGRTIRGNGILEVVSAGTLILANRDLVILRELVLEECHVVTEADVIECIRWFEANPAAYQAAVQRQRDILYEVFYKAPAEKLALKFWEKRGAKMSPSSGYA